MKQVFGEHIIQDGEEVQIIRNDEIFFRNFLHSIFFLYDEWKSFT